VTMDQTIVSKLEGEIEEAIRQVMSGQAQGPGQPRRPSPRTLHLMAKAAVAVYEAAAE
jgi:hypothetical protein